MSKSSNTKLPVLLIGASVVFFFAGMIIVAYTLQDTYNLVGQCEPGSPNCEGITWQEDWIRLGSVLLFVGPVLALVGIILHERAKKPEAEKEEAKPKKSKSKKR